MHAGALCGSLLKSVCRCGLFLCLHAVSKKFIDLYGRGVARSVDAGDHHTLQELDRLCYS